jgi:RNA polymerase sigma-70 factor (ECF subfamily)
VLRAQAGDDAALAALYAQYQPKIQAYLRRRLGAPELAEDLCADVFARMVEHIGSYQQYEGVPFGAWLFSIARRRLVDHVRAQKLEWSLDTVAWSAPALEPARELEAVEQRGWLAAALAELPPDQRRAIELRYAQDLSAQDAARSMGMSPEGVRQLCSRGLHRLRERLEMVPTAA